MFARLGSPFGGHLAPVGVLEEPPASTYLQKILDTDPVAVWMLDGSLGEAIASLNLSIGGGSEVYVSGLPAGVNASFNCAGTNWLTRTHHASLKPAVGALMSWFRVASFHTGSIASCNISGAVNDDFLYQTNPDGTVSFHFQTGGETTLVRTSAAVYTIGQSICSFITWSTAGVRLFISAVTQDSWFNADHTSGLTNNTVAWRFGAQEIAGSLNILDGVLGPQVLWNRIPTRAEIELLTQLEAPPTP